MATVNENIVAYVAAHAPCTFDDACHNCMVDDRRDEAEGAFRGVLMAGLIVQVGKTPLGDQDLYGVP